MWKNEITRVLRVSCINSWNNNDLYLLAETWKNIMRWWSSEKERETAWVAKCMNRISSAITSTPPSCAPDQRYQQYLGEIHVGKGSIINNTKKHDIGKPEHSVLASYLYETSLSFFFFSSFPLLRTSSYKWGRQFSGSSVSKEGGSYFALPHPKYSASSVCTLQFLHWIRWWE